MNKSQIMLVNAMYLYATPQFMKVTTVFAGRDDIFEVAMSKFVTAISEKIDNIELISIFDEELDDIIDQIMLRIQDGTDELLEKCAKQLKQMVLNEKLTPALNCIKHFKKTIPSLTSLDRPILRNDLIAYLCFVKDNNTIHGKAIQDYVGCYQMLFDDLIENQHQLQKLELKIQAWFEAVFQNDINALKRIIKSGIDIESENGAGKSALALAIINNNADAAKLLLSFHAKPKKQVSNDSPVHIAMENNNAEVVKFIIDNFSGCMSKQEWQKSLQKYTTDSSIAIFKLILGLLNNEVDLFKLAETAIQENHTLILKCLFDFGLDVNVKKQTESLSFIALTCNNRDALEQILDQGAYLNTLNIDKKTLLEYALFLSFDSMVEFLISKGIKLDNGEFEWANVIANVEKLASLMSWSIHDSVLRVVRNIKNYDGNGLNILHFLVNQTISNEKKQLEIIKLCDFILNDVGVDVNQLTKNGEHCVMTLTQSEQMFDYLLQKKPNLDIQFSDNQNIIQRVLKKFDGRAFKKLLTAGVDLNVKIDGKALLHYVFNFDSYFVPYLIERGCDVNSKDESGYSILQNKIADKKSFKKDVLMFALLGADFNCLSNKQTPVFHVLCALYDVDTVKEIISVNKVDIHVYDSNGNNAIMQACLVGNIPNVILLANAGVDVKHKNIAGGSPLLHAIYNDNLDLVKCLINHCDVDVTIELANKNIIELAKVFSSHNVFEFLTKNRVLKLIVND